MINFKDICIKIIINKNMINKLFIDSNRNTYRNRFFFLKKGDKNSQDIINFNSLQLNSQKNKNSIFFVFGKNSQNCSLKRTDKKEYEDKFKKKLYNSITKQEYFLEKTKKNLFLKRNLESNTKINSVKDSFYPSETNINELFCSTKINLKEEINFKFINNIKKDMIPNNAIYEKIFKKPNLNNIKIKNEYNTPNYRNNIYFSNEKNYKESNEKDNFIKLDSIMDPR